MVFRSIERVLIANRGEIACRIIRSCKQHNLKSIAIYSKEDVLSLHVAEADEVVLLSGTGAAAYINIEEIVQIAVENACDVVIPGYGFLSENSNFAQELSCNNIIFAGPSPETVEQFGLKHLARNAAIANGVPVVPGSDLIVDVNQLIEVCDNIGYPVILKATAGGGGMGLKVCHNVKETQKNFAEVTSRGGSLFSNDGVFVEKYIVSGRHIEVQLFGNGLGDVVTFGERECSIQRRHQKLLEESPSPFVETLGSQYSLRKKLTNCAKTLAASVKYKSAGTVEFLVDDLTGEFYFLEVNTRLQVEHGITEMVYDVDFVFFMLLQADYEKFDNTGIPVEILRKSLKYGKDNIEIPNGHAIEVRIYAENAVKDFAPSPGILHYVSIPQNGNYGEYKLRTDHWISTGGKVSPYFDPLLAKVMVWSPMRTALNIIDVLHRIKIQGPTHNKEYCISILKSESFEIGNTLTGFLSNFKFLPHLLEFIDSGSYTTIQDLPGRGRIRNGVPQSGPVDSLSLQIANVIVGNDKNMECFEINVKGPIIKFHKSAVVAVAGGNFDLEIDSQPDIPMFAEIFIPAGSVLKIGSSRGNSSKCYLAIKGGLPGVSGYLGSKSCTPSINLGGHQGRIIFPGDCLEIPSITDFANYEVGYKIPQKMLPHYEREINVIRMIGGPHDTPDIVSEKGLKELYSTEYRVNFNSNRGAIRLDGPPLIFSRMHGGDGGGHPSNILEYPYPTCGLSAVGSTMVLFGVDGATLSGFACISVPTEVDFWKFGQATVNSPIRFRQITYKDSIKLKHQRARYLSELFKRPTDSTAPFFTDELEQYETITEVFGKLLYSRPANDQLPFVAFRQAGDSMIIIDFGNEVFDFFNNGRQYVLKTQIEKNFPGKFDSIECSSGAMCVTFDPLHIDRDELLNDITKLEDSIPPIESLKVPSRVFKLPLCFDHSSLTHCLERYTRSQRPHAPYLPSNVDYLMKANCLKTLDDFKNCIIGKPEVVVAVSFLCANPLLVNIDPRSRFTTSKYNPARTSTPAGTIGSGSVSQSIYTVESPGGYMIWGVTLPSWFWDTFSRNHENPWPLKNFDQVVFYEVSEHELNCINNQFLAGRLEIKPKPVEFDFVDYRAFVDSINIEREQLAAEKSLAFRKLVQDEDNDMKKWKEEILEAKALKPKVDDMMHLQGAIKIVSFLNASVFKINYKKGSNLRLGDTLFVLEAMKMEIAISVSDKNADVDTEYEVLEIIVDEGDLVNPGSILGIVKVV